MKRHLEIQSVEVSCFVHATEDEARLEKSIERFFDLRSKPFSEILEGHFGNRIVHLTWHVIADEAWSAFEALVRGLGAEERATILADLDSLVDDHGALYVRIKKQSIFEGVPMLSSSDPMRVRVKPRRFMIRGGAKQFYQGLFDEVPPR